MSIPFFKYYTEYNSPLMADTVTNMKFTSEILLNYKNKILN